MTGAVEGEPFAAKGTAEAIQELVRKDPAENFTGRKEPRR